MTDTADRANNRAGVVFGGIWLLFLVFPITALVASDAPAAWRVLAAASTALFAIVYLISYLHPSPGPLGTFGGAAVWTVVLGALAVVTVPAIGAQALSLAPFLVAIPVFRLPTPWDAVGALVPIAVTITLIVALGEPQDLLLQISIALAPLALMLPIRRVVDSLRRRSTLNHELALSRQREQVGRDVHDILGHSLTVMAVKAELAGKLLDRDPERARAELDDILMLARSSLGDVRTTVSALQAPHLESQLTAAEAALDASGIRVERPTELPELVEKSSRLLAWCLREAVTNVVRHSDASSCTIAVSDTTLTVTDDGVGRRGGAEGNGLRGMRERVAEVGGKVRMDDARPGHPRAGTRLEVTL